jgi:DNA-binding cell septation regulator SpoVG
MPKKTNTNNNEYQQLVESLKKKYGVIATPYFLDEQLTIKNTKITRGKEGLFIHHIKEDK